MKTVIRFSALVGVFFAFFACTKEKPFEKQDRFLPDLVSTEAVEYGISFTPSGDSCFFVRHTGEWGRTDNPPANILLITFQNGVWSTPVPASFSKEETNDDDVFISPDGAAIFFTSNRDYPGKSGRGSDIWKIEKVNGVWGEPFPLDSLVNSPNMESSPVTNRRGDLYFTSIREEGPGQGDIYFAEKQLDGSYAAPVLIPILNSEQGEWNLFVEPDEQWVIFESSGRPAGKSNYGDLYFSKKIGGVWQEPVALVDINTTGSELNVRLGPGGKYLYYACSYFLESTDADILRIPLSEVLSQI